MEGEGVGERWVSKFAVPKRREKRPFPEYFRFYVKGGTQVDPSRDIAKTKTAVEASKRR